MTLVSVNLWFAVALLLLYDVTKPLTFENVRVSC